MRSYASHQVQALRGVQRWAVVAAMSVAEHVLDEGRRQSGTARLLYFHPLLWLQQQSQRLWCCPECASLGVSQHV